MTVANQQRRGLAGLRIFVVEDWHMVAKEIQTFLDEFGCEVVGPVPSLEAALKAAKTEEMDGALLDVNLGDQDVMPVAKILKERGIPMILVTGYGSAVDTSEIGDVPIIEKPFDEVTLRQAMLDVFRR